MYEKRSIYRSKVITLCLGPRAYYSFCIESNIHKHFIAQCPQNGHTHNNNSAENDAELLLCV